MTKHHFKSVKMEQNKEKLSQRMDGQNERKRINEDNKEGEMIKERRKESRKEMRKYKGMKQKEGRKERRL